MKLAHPVQVQLCDPALRPFPIHESTSCRVQGGSGEYAEARAEAGTTSGKLSSQARAPCEEQASMRSQM
eukprot:scaffold165833_cov22-Tisochrysis_lutea.AAC.3